MPANNAASLRQSVELARKASKPAPAKPGILAPSHEDLPLDDALALIEVHMWNDHVKVSFSVTDDAQSVYVRLAVPGWSDHDTLAGKSAIVFAGSLPHAFQKAAQLLNGDWDNFWKEDPYARK